MLVEARPGGFGLIWIEMHYLPPEYGNNVCNITLSYEMIILK